VLFEQLEGRIRQVQAVVDTDAENVTVVAQLPTIVPLVVELTGAIERSMHSVNEIGAHRGTIP